MPIPLTATGIDPANPQVKPLLTDLQGNILKGHGRDHTINLFIRFKPNRRAAARDWISIFSSTFVTSAARQLEQTNFFKTRRVSAGMFTNLFLTASGYNYLGITDDSKLPKEGSVVDDAQNQPDVKRFPFRAGLRKARKALHDPEASGWDAGYDADIHAMILIADDSPQLVRALKRAIIFSLKDTAIILREEPGRAIRNAKGNGIEHNGYADGVSQPLFFQKDIDDEAANLAAEGGHNVWNPEASLALALVKDPGGKTADSYGSFFVFRKLEQNVKKFKKQESELANKLQLADPSLAGALVVGRFEDGTPVTKFGITQDPDKDKVPNNFDYMADTGNKCPFHGHIRKTNPRTDSFGGTENGTAKTIEDNKTRRLVRRGIPYEDKPRVLKPNGDFDENYLPEGGVGLLFMCFVADIGFQFEFMQQFWANLEQFSIPNPLTGIDPIIGQHNGVFNKQHWPKAWNGNNTDDFQFADAVTMKGGAYFFAPSMSFLKGLRVNGNPTLPEALQIFI